MTKPKRAAKTKAVAVMREPTEAERSWAAADQSREVWEPPQYEVALQPNGVIHFSAPHSDRELWRAEIRSALGLNCEVLTNEVEKQLMALRYREPKTQADVEALRADLRVGLAFVASIQPRSMLEVTLAVQMWAQHLVVVDMSSRQLRATQIPQFTAYSGLLNKSARTFAAQIETLTKMRSGGKQTVEVRHVYIDARTQTVVAPQVHGVEGGLSDAPLPPLRCEDAAGFALSGSLDQGQAALPDARRPQSRRSERREERAV